MTAHLGFAYSLAWVTGGYVLALPDDSSPLHTRALDVATVRKAVEARDVNGLVIGCVLWDVPANALEQYMQQGGEWTLTSQALPQVYEALDAEPAVRRVNAEPAVRSVSAEPAIHSIQASAAHKYRHRPARHRSRAPAVGPTIDRMS